MIPPNHVPDAFHSYFLSSTKTTGTQSTFTISYLKTSHPNDFQKTYVITATEAELTGLIGSFKNTNSLGYDSVSSKILKFCGTITTKLLTYIFNTSLFLWHFSGKTQNVPL